MNDHLASPNFLAFGVIVVAYMAFSGYAWLRLDSLCDRYEEATAGGRVRRALARQIGAMVGWWLIAGAVMLWAFYSAAVLTLPLFSLGALLVVLAVISRRRGDAPVFWGAV